MDQYRLPFWTISNRQWLNMLLDLHLACPTLCRASWWTNQTSTLLMISVSFLIWWKILSPTKWRYTVSPESQSNMTDGAGKTNRWTLKQLRHRIEWEDKPTAIQTRIYGTKVGFPVILKFTLVAHTKPGSFSRRYQKRGRACLCGAHAFPKKNHLSVRSNAGSRALYYWCSSCLAC